MNDAIKNLFGEEALSYTEFTRRAGEAKMILGDLSEAEARHKKEVDSIRIAHVLDNCLERSGAKNSELVKRAINMDAVTVENGQVFGIDEQLTALQASDPYLFRERETARTGGEHGSAFADPDGMTDADYYRIRMGNR